MTDDKVTRAAQVKAQGRQARCAPEQGIRGDAPDVCDRYCSDCAWPYECAAAQSCHRRDLGEVRGLDLASAPDMTGYYEQAGGASE